MLPLPPGPFGAIVADPPWTFRARSPKGENRSPSQHYPCMGQAAIGDIPVAAAAAPDCMLFLWVPQANLLQGLEVMAAWGFTYKSLAFIWAKTTKAGDPFMGLGYWTRAGGEICLLGTMGRPKRTARDVRQLIVEPPREHSRKPDVMLDRVRRLVAGPYLELFSRTRRDGWESWGNEPDKFKVAA